MTKEVLGGSEFLKRHGKRVVAVSIQVSTVNGKCRNVQNLSHTLRKKVGRKPEVSRFSSAPPFLPII